MASTRMFYNGGDASGIPPAVVFTVNGKGDWGDGRSWDDNEQAIAVDLDRYIQKSVNTEAALYEGDCVWIVCHRDWGIGEWKEEVTAAYRRWKTERLPLFP